jgi:hypothetical protein
MPFCVLPISRYNETMQTIAEWEDEKKAKARRQKEPREVFRCSELIPAMF